MFRSIATFFVLWLTTATATASLYMAPNGQAIYDAGQDITWVADANLANTSGYCSVVDNCVYAGNSPMDWSDAQAWIASLNSVSYLGVSSWRLPNTAQPDATCASEYDSANRDGFNCTGSEMGHLYNVDGITSSTPGLFSNVVFAYYWSGTEFAPDAATTAWVFSFADGVQASSTKPSSYSTWAVAPGNPFNAVPIPPAALLFAAALAALGVTRRRRQSGVLTGLPRGGMD
jgi:hypothetical protein